MTLSDQTRVLQLDGLVGPTHNYAGLSFGNVASDAHRGVDSDPRRAAIEGLAKARFVAGLGVPQGVLPPQMRPSLTTLRAWGFAGRDDEVLARAAADHGGLLLRLASSASSMWAANAATVAPSADTTDGRVHFVVANLASTAHRQLEASATERALRAIFADARHFVVEGALPGGVLIGDEGAANHTRLVGDGGGVHLFAWGKSAASPVETPVRFPARQSFEASAAVARRLALAPGRAIFARQHPTGIDAGGFHTDVLAVGEGGFLLAHELAFAEPSALDDVAAHLGHRGVVRRVRSAELRVKTAVAEYPFNSQLVALPAGGLAVIAPAGCEADPSCRALFDALIVEANPVVAVHYLDVRQSMQNGGGPACLRLRVPLSKEEIASLEGRVLVDATLIDELEAWVVRHYRDRLSPADLADPALAREVMVALDELTRILALGSLYDFQR